MLGSLGVSLQNLACHSWWHQLLVRKPQLGRLVAGVALPVPGEEGPCSVNDRPERMAGASPAQLSPGADVAWGRDLWLPPLSPLLQLPPILPIPFVQRLDWLMKPQLWLCQVSVCGGGHGQSTSTNSFPFLFAKLTWGPCGQHPSQGTHPRL